MSETARPLSEWHEDFGAVLWWKFPIDEPPYVGTPHDLGQTVEVSTRAHNIDKLMRFNIGGWPGYHTHWTPMPEAPVEPSAFAFRIHSSDEPYCRECHGPCLRRPRHGEFNI